MKALKSIFAFLLVFCLLATSAVAETVVLANKTGALHLRKGPGTNYASAGTLRHGDSIDVLSYGDVWSKVRTADGKVGYIKNLYIQGSGSGSYGNNIDYFSRPYVAYTTGNVNFRSGADRNSASMGVLPKGTEVTVLGQNGDFFMVRLDNGSQGYVSKNYISKTAPAQTPVSASVCLAIRGGALHLRKGPGTGYASVGILRHGDSIQVLNRGDIWAHVKNQAGVVGYIKNLYVKDSNTLYAAGVNYYNSPYTAYTTGNVNFRAGASVNTARMSVLFTGTEITVLGKNGSFCLVKDKTGTQGFVSSNYISRTRPVVKEIPEFSDMREVYNPEHYDMLYVTDMFETDGITYVQGCFGTMGEFGPTEGFDTNSIFTLSLMPGCEIMLPTDFDNPAELFPDVSPVQWYADATAAWGTGDAPFAFHANFSMNEAGELKYFSYCYLP